MDLRYTPEQDAFRAEARAWLEANVPADPLPSFDTETGFALHREWERTLSAGRWSAVSWPEEYGGRGADYLHWLIFEEEYYRAGAPGRVNQNGIFLLGPTIMEVGTDEQKARFLPRWRRARSCGRRRGVNRTPDPISRRSGRPPCSPTTVPRGSQRAEDLGVPCGVGRLVLWHLPHRSRRRASPRPHLPAGAARCAGRHRAPHRAARRRHRVRRDLLRRRTGPGGEHVGRGERGMACGDGDRGVRTRREPSQPGSLQRGRRSAGEPLAHPR